MMFRAFPGVRGALAIGFGAVLALQACGTTDSADPDAEPQCLTQPGPLDCDALYGFDTTSGTVKPTFAQVYTNTFSPRCGTSGCHSGSSPAGGMNLGTEDDAFTALHANGSNGIPRVKGGDIECGMVIVRTETPGKSWSMPQGTHLRDPDLCALRNWIANGAER